MSAFLRHLIYEQYFLSVPEPIQSFEKKTVIVTGANSGLGKEAALHLARLKCSRLILGVRNSQAGEAAREDIIATTGLPSTNIEVWDVDLSSFKSVCSFADRASSELDRFDVLICNAGINTFKFVELEGYESMLTVNVLSTYLMAKRMLPLLERSATLGPAKGDPDPRPPHLTFVGSDTHLTITSLQELKEPPENMLDAITKSCKASAGRFRAEYGFSKLLILLLGRDIVYRQCQSGPNVGNGAVNDPEQKNPVIINVISPGMCYSNLMRDIPGPARVAQFILHARPARMGGSAIVRAAGAGWDSNGQFLSSGRVHQGSSISWDMTTGERLRASVEGALAKAGYVV